MSLYRRAHFSLQPLLLVILTTVFLIDTQKQLYSADLSFPSIPSSQIELLKHSMIPLKNLDDNQSVLNLINHKPLVLIGDSNHGTYEFYQQRISISQQLIQEKNFKSILLEGDWPNVYLLNQYVQSLIPVTAEQAIQAYNPQGAWLWNNRAMIEFLKWLKSHNQQLPEDEQKVSLYGLDIYSFKQSKQQVIDYLADYSLLAARQAKHRYQCFTAFNDDLHRYAKAVKKNYSLSCEKPVIDQFMDFTACRIPCPEESDFIDREAFFYDQQNARIVKNSEKNLRVQYMAGNDLLSWNERDKHMMETLIAVSEHLHHPKTIVWAHNSHLGDARATEMAQRNQLNLGQLMRVFFGQSVFSIGMFTYSGTVMAADERDEPARLKVLNNARYDSYEALFHSANIPHFLLSIQQSADSQQSQELLKLLAKKRLQRHVGVVYKPENEMASHYTYTSLAQEFDAIIFNDSTRAVTPVNSR
ncbi:MAG: erythromycin esterase family protein [gamma proteobacterium symbiont of Bathyaustriella thionipta]|nr:erythromycin esterase family protein [gamma proteobacterium symbiont of Bathyaustriella thionipta]MCU7951590.1 erythromycin esterase family protein [gamma proteobacterium symbiont of Bathyaustriella thionipta]MCU7958192.1 erythromycin esterase family protein [gamma proteobacterium symbiont of Bathyaustriella thionipta]MCU7965772.1 erythromycin esterase family protein [gamma proteobacterium symbiont of Bathyaustriella thionipta]